MYIHMYIYSSRFATRTAAPRELTERKEAGLLGLTKSRLRSNLAALGLKLGRTGASPSGVQHGATWARLDASST